MLLPFSVLAHVRRLASPVLALALLSVVGPASSTSVEAVGFTPAPGALFNDPLGSRPAQRRIADHVVRSVDSAPPGATVRMSSWEIRARGLVESLISAHQRGVTVRVVMDKQNADAGNPNRPVSRLRQELRGSGNAERPESQRSGLTRCKASCRGNKGGFVHSKFYLLSQSGQAERVVITTSANATVQAATAQWNDAYTLVGDQEIYDGFARVFDEMYADQPVALPAVQVGSGATTAAFHPLGGVGPRRDPILRELSQVRCRGAANVRDGRTEVRFAVTSWFGARGLAIGERLRTLARQGCDVRGVYAVAGDRVLRDLRRPGAGTVRARQVVQNLGPARGYDRYLHGKVLTVRGRQGAARSATVTLNGSANWTPLSVISDEVVLRLTDAGTLRRYTRWIERLFTDPPPNPRGRGPQIPDRRAPGGPGSGIQVD